MKKSVIVADGTFSCTTAPLQGSYEEVFREAATIGYDAVQLTVNRPTEVNAVLVKRIADEMGLRISALATGMGYTVDGLSLGAGVEEKRQLAVARMKEHIDLAEALGGAMVIIGAIRGWTRDAVDPSLYYRQFHKSVEEVLAYAEPRNITVILESNDHLETDAYIKIKETAEYVRSFHSPCFKLHLDTMHMLYEKEEIYDQICSCADILAQVDISGDGRRCPEAGQYDYPLVIRALKDSHFDGYLAFEYRPEPFKNTAKMGYDYICGLIAG